MVADLRLERQQAHELIERLPPALLGAVVNLMQAMVENQMPQAFPLDDEPETEEERAAVAAGLDSLERNGGIPMETILADFGLTMQDFERMATTAPPEPAR